MATLTIQPATADTFIASNVPNTNYDTNTRIIVSHDIPDRGLLNFDFSAIPPGSVINSAILSLYVNNLDSGVLGRTHDANRITQTLWISSQATWNDYITSTAWAAAGGDFTTTDKASATVPAADNWMDWDVKVLAQWFLDNASGIGDFLIKDASEAGGAGVAAYFRSNSDGTSSTRPKLVIDYTAPIAIDAALNLSLSALSPASITNFPVITPSAQALTLALLSPIITAGIIVLVSEQAAALALPVPIIITDAIVIPSTQAISLAQLSPVAEGSISVMLSALGLTLAMPVPTPVSNETALPSASTMALAINTPLIFRPSPGTFETPLPLLALSATGVTGGIDSVIAALPMFTLEIRAGLRAIMSLPILTLSATGTSTNGGILSKKLPLLTLSASGQSEGSGTLTRSLPMFTLNISMRVGGIHAFASSLPMITLDGRGINGVPPGTLAKTLPLITLASSGYNSGNGTFVKSLPMLTLDAFGTSYTNRII